MNALRRSITLVLILFAVTAVAVTAGAVSAPLASAVGGDATFQQNTSNASTNATNASTAVPNTTNVTNTSANTMNASTNASITFANQTRNGRSVYVASATLPDGGFVVLEEPGPNGTVVGVSLPLDPGTHEGKITLRGVPGADSNRSRLGANTTLVATLHRDSDGDGRFDGLLAPGIDQPYTDNGTPVSDRAHVTIPDDERPTAASVTLTDQTSRGTNVTVKSVTLAGGGYVGIHRGGYNRSNATESIVGATGYLEPGTYENVTVEVGAGVQNTATLTDSGRISAVVYEDTDGDRRFQYVPSGGVEDQPSLTNGTAVAASARLTIERPQTPTPTATPTTTETSTQTPLATAEPRPPARDRATPYGGESDGREGILDNPLFPVLVVVFAIFAVLAAIGQ